MYQLRNSEGVMKADLPEKMASAITLKVPGYWRNYNAQDFVARAYVIEDDFLMDLRHEHGQHSGVTIWVNSGDLLIDSASRRPR